MTNDSNNRIAEIKLDIEEWEKLKQYVERDTVSVSIDDKILSLKRLLGSLEPTKQSDTVQKILPVEPIYAPITNYGWDQTTEFIKIYITFPTDLLEAHASVLFGSQSLDVKVHNSPGCPDQRLNIKKLFKAIDSEKCKYRIRKNTISITLKKADLSWWEDLKFKEAPKMPKLDTPGNNKTDPGASLMNMMKNLYDEGDSDMKRTIAKAWSESQNKQGIAGTDGIMF